MPQPNPRRTASTKSADDGMWCRGGVARPQSYELVGGLAAEALDQLTCDVCFLGASGLGTEAHRRARPANGLALLGGGVLLVAVVTGIVLLGDS